MLSEQLWVHPIPPNQKHVVLLIGGAYLITQSIGKRETTGDIDVIVKIDNPHLSEEYRLFKSAVRFVAYDLGIQETWLNDLIAESLRASGKVPEGTSWRTFGKLVEIYLPPKDYILACKLMAGRPKDQNDIIALCRALRIKSYGQAQRIVDAYFPNQQEQLISGLAETLERFFRKGG